MGAGKRTEDGRQKSVVRAITDNMAIGASSLRLARALQLSISTIVLRLSVFPPITHGSKGSSKLLDEF